MELASQESIRSLLPGCGNPARVRVRRAVQHVAQPPSKGRKVRCTCGQCRQCLDDAWWERIFAERFAGTRATTRAKLRTGHRP
jgi:hypothetical protein